MLGLNLEEIYAFLENLSTGNFKKDFGRIIAERGRGVPGFS
jgi:hypothetical protein